MLCLCASPQLIHQAECLEDVARGTIARTYSAPKYAHSRTSIPPIEPPITTAICLIPRSSKTSLCMLHCAGNQSSLQFSRPRSFVQVCCTHITHLTSSR